MAREQPNLERLGSINVDGSRKHPQPADVKGRFMTARTWVYALLIVVYVALPFLKVGGYPALQLDVAARRFYLFGSVFNAQDFWRAAFLVVILGVGLLFVTAWVGRVWCGWACPQTVFLEGVYRRIERWVDGPREKRIRMMHGPWTAEKVLRRIIKHALFLLISTGLAHVAMSFFVTPKGAFDMVRNGPNAHWTAFVWVTVVTLALYFNFAWFREQMCIVICPYGRMQSVLLDRDSLIIGYDVKRGEPRGKIRRNRRAAPARKSADLVQLGVKAGAPSAKDRAQGQEQAQGQTQTKDQAASQTQTEAQTTSQIQDQRASQDQTQSQDQTASQTQPEAPSETPPAPPTSGSLALQSDEAPAPKSTAQSHENGLAALASAAVAAATPAKSSAINGSSASSPTAPSSSASKAQDASCAVAVDAPLAKRAQNLDSPRANSEPAPLGDCIDCNRCVVVCPTGIDIRNGTQMECIACAQCIDACDEVMRKVGRPTGLIRYDSQNGLEGSPKKTIRLRLVTYGGMLMVAAALFLLTSLSRQPFEANPLRVRGAPYVVDQNGIRNQFELHLVNKNPGRSTLSVEVRAPVPIKVILPHQSVSLDPLDHFRLPVFIQVQQEDWSGPFDVIFHIEDSASKSSRDFKSRFLGPSGPMASLQKQ